MDAKSAKKWLVYIEKIIKEYSDQIIEDERRVKNLKKTSPVFKELEKIEVIEYIPGRPLAHQEEINKIYVIAEGDDSKETEGVYTP